MINACSIHRRLTQMDGLRFVFCVLCEKQNILIGDFIPAMVLPPNGMHTYN